MVFEVFASCPYLNMGNHRLGVIWHSRNNVVLHIRLDSLSPSLCRSLWPFYVNRLNLLSLGMTFVNWYWHLWKLSTLQIKKVQLPQNTMHATLWNPHTTPKLFRFPLIVLFVCLFVFCGFEKKHQKQLAKVFYLFYLDKLNWSKSSKQQIKTKRQPFLPFFSRKLITTMNANASAKNLNRPFIFSLSPIAVIINICKKTHAHNFIFTLKLTPNLFSSFFISFYLLTLQQQQQENERKKMRKYLPFEGYANQFYEFIQLSALWNFPCSFVCLSTAFFSFLSFLSFICIGC